MKEKPELQLPFEKFDDRQIWDAAWGESDMDSEDADYPVVDPHAVSGFPGSRIKPLVQYPGDDSGDVEQVSAFRSLLSLSDKVSPLISVSVTESFS